MLRWGVAGQSSPQPRPRMEWGAQSCNHQELRAAGTPKGPGEAEGPAWLMPENWPSPPSL